MAPRRTLRALLIGVLLLALALGGCGAGGARQGGGGARTRPVTLLLDFQPNAVHAGIYAAVARGYDRDRRLALHVHVPSDSTDAVRLLVAGRTDLAILDIHDLAIARERGRDLVGVMALVQRPLAAVLAQPQIRTPRDLEGRHVGVTGLPSDDAVLRSIVAGAHGDPTRVRPVTIGFDAVRSLLTGRVAGATAFWDVEGVALHARRPGFREFRVDDYGAPAYPELVLTVTRRTLRSRPRLVGDAVNALVRGYDSLLADPRAGLDALLSHADGLDRPTAQRELAAVRPAFGRRAHVGELDPRRLSAWARWERHFGIVKRLPDVARAFDDRFVAGDRGDRTRPEARLSSRRRMRSSGAPLVWLLALGTAAFALAACGGRDDERAIRDTIRSALTSTDPDDCAAGDATTAAFRRQYALGSAALARQYEQLCRTQIGHLAATGVRVFGVKADGDKAQAGFSASGGQYALTQARVQLRKDDDHWKLDRLTAVTLDRRAYDAQQLRLATGGSLKLSQAHAACFSRRVKNVADTTLERAIVSSDGAVFADPLLICFVRPQLRQFGLSIPRTRCTILRMRRDAAGLMRIALATTNESEGRLQDLVVRAATACTG